MQLKQSSRTLVPEPQDAGMKSYQRQVETKHPPCPVQLWWILDRGTVKRPEIKISSTLKIRSDRSYTLMQFLVKDCKKLE